MGFSEDIDDFDDGMDLWGIFMFFFLAFIIMSCCGYCCSRKQRGAVLSAPVVVTSATHTHTVQQMPVSATTTAYQTQAYSAPYPTQGAPAHMPMPMPMTTGQPPAAAVYPNVAPYPTMGTANMNPPPYDVAVSGAGAGQPNHTLYEKQSPYNPNYQM